jgi:phage-related protein
MKPLLFVGSSLDDLRRFPDDAKRIAGHELWQIQNGLMPSDFKSMTAIGPGCYEIRIHVRGEWRLFYVANDVTAVYVLHVFRKKTQTTSQSDIRIARKRLRAIADHSRT